jgi:ferritin
MLSKKIGDILNLQVEKEAYSSVLYLSMASWAQTNGFAGISQWLYIQSDEERLHMLKFVHYINDRGGKALVSAIKQPPVEFGSIIKLFEEVLKHEQFVTDSINQIVALTLEEKDYTTHSWVQWFVNEQIEEEVSVSEILDKLKLVGETNMYIFDRDIVGMRTKNKPAAK